MSQLYTKGDARSAAVVACVHPKVTVPESFLYTAPTAMALPMQAGTAICVLDPLFPLEAKRRAPRPRSGLVQHLARDDLGVLVRRIVEPLPRRRSDSRRHGNRA